MVKKADVEKCKRAIALLSEQMGVPLFLYDEIHKPIDGQASNYDFNKVIDDYARYSEGVIREGVSAAAWQAARERAKKKLIDMGVLVPAANGEFAVRFDDTAKIDSDAYTKNGCVYAKSLKKASIEDVQEIYQQFAEAYAKRNASFSSDSVLDEMYAKFYMDRSMESRDNVKDYKEYLEGSFGAAHTLALTGKGSKGLAKKAGMGNLAEGCNDEILKEVKRVVNDARREGTLRGYATQGWRWLKAKVTGKEDDRFSVSRDDLFDKNGQIKVDALREVTKQIVKDKAQHPEVFANNLAEGRQKAQEKAEKRANSRFWRTIDYVKDKNRAFKKWKSHNILLSKDARLDRKIKSQLKKEIKAKITATTDNEIAVQSMNKILQGMQLLTLQTGMDPLSGELLKTMLKTQMESGKPFDKEAREEFADKFVYFQKQMGKDTISKGDLKQFLKVVDKAVLQNEGNADFKKLTTYLDRPYNDVKKVMDTALNDYGNFVSADLAPSNRISPLMGASYEQTLVFISAGMDVTKRDAMGKTALHYAKDGNVVDVLCAVCPELVNMTDNQGRTAVHDARNVDVIEQLKERGANLSAKDNNGQTLAHLVSDYEVIKKLSDLGADFTITDDKGNTPLMTNISTGKIQGVFEAYMPAGEKEALFNKRNNDGMSLLDLVVDNHDIAPVQKNDILSRIAYTGLVDGKGALKYAEDSRDVNAVMDAFRFLPQDKKQEMVSDALMGKITPSKIEAIAQVCDANGLDKKAVFDYKDDKGRTPIVSVLQSDMTKEQKMAISTLLVQNGADFKVATDYIKQEQAKQEEEKKKQEEEKKKQEEKAKEEAKKDEPEPKKDEPKKDEPEPKKDEPKKDEPEPKKDEPKKDEPKKDEPTVEPKKRDLGEVFAEHPELSAVYAGLVADRKPEQVKAINNAFQLIDGQAGDKAAVEDKIFTSLINSNAFNDKEKAELFDKLVKAEEKRTGMQVLPGGVKVENVIDKANKDEILKFSYRDGSSIEFSKKDMSVTKKYKDEKGETKEIKLVGSQAKKLQTDLLKLGDKGLGAQGRALPKLFDEARKVPDNSKVENKGVSSKVINQMQASIGK